ncbi:MAG: hypothetical protein V3U87_09990 [Methylococcaceae bacterium]
MKFNNITGDINYVPLKTYDELIGCYVDIVKKVNGVKSIIQIGSFTAPGLSDIDIIVIVDNKNPPKWDEISIKKLLTNKNGYEVIAHDVFVYPEYLAKYIEGLFYLNSKTILHGKDIGGYLPDSMITELKLIITFEYSVHRLETLVVLTSLSTVHIRDILLLISTLRHTYDLLYDFDLIKIEDRDQGIQNIEELRKYSLNKNKDMGDLIQKLNEWIIPCYKSIYKSTFLLGNKLNYIEPIKLTSWILNYKKLIYNINNIEQAVINFIKFCKLNKLFSAKILVYIMPYCVYQHVSLYQKINNENLMDFDCMTPLNLRYVLASDHKKFLQINHYPIANSYIITDNTAPRPSDLVKKYLLSALKLISVVK